MIYDYKISLKNMAICIEKLAIQILVKYVDNFFFQGDQRERICRLLVECGLVKSEQLKVHGF